jgi:hypothetical protein
MFKKLITLILLCLFSGVSWSQCIEGDCRNGYGTFKNGDTIYIGTFKNGHQDGKGKITYGDLGSYIGEFKNTTLHGYGTLTGADGKTYTGEFKNNSPNGNGELILPDGAKYNGGFRDGKYHGQGTYTGVDGKKIIGEFNTGRFPVNTAITTNEKPKNIESVTDCPDDISLGLHNCFGTYTYSTGDKYVGEWQDNYPHGQGTFTWANGDKYVGEYQNGEITGQGAITLASGDKYVGEFQDTERHGQGTYTWANGDKYVGEYQNDRMHTKRFQVSTFTWHYGEKYVGEYKDGKRHGQGISTFPNGIEVKGNFVNGDPDGINICSSPEGSYACEWINGELQPYEQVIQTKAVATSTPTKPKTSIGAKIGGFLAEAFIEGISKGIQVAIINEFNEPCTPTVRVKNTTLRGGTGPSGMTFNKTRVKVKTCPARYYFLN